MWPSSKIPSVLLSGSILLSGCAENAPDRLTQAQVEDALRQANLVVSAGPPAQRTLTAYVTGYSYWDNTPQGSAAIAIPVVHQTAGGQGTFADPITLAVGYSITDGGLALDFPLGTRFYLKRMKKYAVVEDLCGNGPTPQNGPCHTGYGGHPWLDIYIGGRGIDMNAAQGCAEKITGLQAVVINPVSNLPVSAGEVANTLC